MDHLKAIFWVCLVVRLVCWLVCWLWSHRTP